MEIWVGILCPKCKEILKVICLGFVSTETALALESTYNNSELFCMRCGKKFNKGSVEVLENEER